MLDQPLIARRSAARLLMGPLAAFCVSIPASGFPDEEAQEKVTAARVAKKVERARDKSDADQEEHEAVEHFRKEVAKYAGLHGKALARVGAVQTPEAQKALAAAITARRIEAKQGDIFLPEVQAVFKRLLGAQLKGPDATAAKKAMVEGNPGHDEDSILVAVRVNAPYPRGAARSTVPPSVLLTLPPLPECLSYLFVGRDLILVDTAAQLIVDFIPTAAPELIK